MSAGKVVIGVLAGVAVGALVGILFAPEKGSDMRRKIARKTSDASEDLKDTFDDLLCSLTEKLETVKEQTNKLFEDGKDKASEIRKTAKTELS